MKLTIFGATGAAGAVLVSQALAEGDEVTAYVRTPAKLGLHDERLTIIRGELSDQRAIEQAVVMPNLRGTFIVIGGVNRDKCTPHALMTPASMPSVVVNGT